MQADFPADGVIEIQWGALVEFLGTESAGVEC